MINYINGAIPRYTPRLDNAKATSIFEQNAKLLADQKHPGNGIVNAKGAVDVMISQIARDLNKLFQTK